MTGASRRVVLTSRLLSVALPFAASYVANKRAQQRTVNELLDSIEDILSPAAPLQVKAAFYF